MAARLTWSFLAQIESNYDEVTDSFDSMSLKAELLRGELTIQDAPTLETPRITDVS